MAHAYLNRVAGRLRAGGLHTQTRVLAGTSPSAAILEVARRENIDLIALATRGRGALRRLLWGSVAESIVWRSIAPVLVYHTN